MPVTKQKHPSLFKLRHLAMVFPQMREGRVVGGGGEEEGPLGIHYLSKFHLWQQKMLYTNFNPLTPMSDQERISPYIIHTVSSRQVMRIEKNNN